jgi:HSP20 family molecular chaperone IbpA
MGLRNVANLFDYVNDSLDGDRAWSDHDEWTQAWKGWANDNNTHFNETEDGYSFYVALAGLEKDEVKVSVADNRVKIEAKGKSAEREVEYDKSFSVPTKADITTLEAKMENGMLSINIGKREKDKNRTIKVT